MSPLEITAVASAIISPFNKPQKQSLKPFKTLKGYYRVDIFKDEQRTTKLIHRLVAAAFLEPPQNIDMQIHHKDFDSTNNKADNLIWLNPQQHKQIHLNRRKEQINATISDNT